MMGKGIIWLAYDDMLKFNSRGIVLPIGYELSDQAPWYDHTRACWGIVIAGPDIPVTPPMQILPDLDILRGFQSLIVKSYTSEWIKYSSEDTGQSND